MKIYVITALLAVVVAVAAETQTCPEGRVFKECGSACEKTCEDYLRSKNGGGICTLECVPGCYCKDGYENKNGVCVDAESCREYRTCAKGDDKCIIGNDIVRVEGIIKNFGKDIPDRILPEGLRIIDNISIDGGTPPSTSDRPTGDDRPTRPSRTDGVKPSSRPDRPTGDDRPTRPSRTDGVKPSSRPDRPTGDERPTRPDRPDGSKPPPRPTGEDRPTRPDRPDGDRPTRPGRPDGGRPTRPGRPDGDRPTRPGRPDGGRPTRPGRPEPRPGREGRNSRV